MRLRWLAGVAAVFLATAVAVSPGTPAMADPSTVREAQWYLAPLRIPEAQQISTGAGVVVAVVDTPIDSRVPDLAGQLLPGYSIVPNAPNGLSQGTSTAHGTGMAGLIAAKGGSDMHLLGIAPGAKILPVAVNTGAFASLGASGPQVADGIRWAADHGAKVINLSVGAAGAPSAAEVDAVRYAMAKDVVVVASAGNVAESGPGVATPASIPGVVAVSGVIENGDAWNGSGTGPQVVVAAPAINVASTAPTEFAASGYATNDGTSPAAAITSGVVALIRAKFPQLNAANVINRLIATARDNGNPGRDPVFGFGTIRPVQALTADVPPVSANPLITAASAAPTASGTASGPTGIHRIPRAAIVAILAAVVVVVVLLVVLLARRGRRRGLPPGGPGASQGGWPVPPQYQTGPPPYQTGPPPYQTGPPPYQTGSPPYQGAPPRPPEGGR
jgi:type VII secretion-associated serine protease mycosin